MRPIIIAVVLALTVTPAMAEPELPAAIVDLYKSGKLFDKKDAKAVRTAFAQVLEARFASERKEAFGDDFDSLEAFLKDKPELKNDLFLAIDPAADDVIGVFRVFRDLWKASPELVAKYPQTAIATAVVWDRPKGSIYDYVLHQRRVRGTLPSEYGNVNAVENFRYFVEHDKELQAKEQLSRLQALPWEFQVYLVDHRTPVSEREWAVKNYLPRRNLVGAIYKEVEYDKEMLRTKGARCKLEGKPYTLESIRQHGGVCAMQADFSARVAKSLAVPAAYIRGEGAGLELHAWVIWLEFKKVTPDRVEFVMVSYGQYPDMKFYTGDIIDPHTGNKTTEREMDRQLTTIGQDRVGYHQAEMAMRAFPKLCEQLSLDAAAKVAYLDKCQALCPLHHAAWQEMATLAKAGSLKDKTQQVTSKVDSMLRTFKAHPDFTWVVYDDLASIRNDTAQRIAAFEKLYLMYEQAGRGDLAGQARMKIAGLQAEAGNHQGAAKGLAGTIEKFPTEGREVPKLMAKLEEECAAYKGGIEFLGAFYLRVLPAIPPSRMGEVSKYCMTMYDQAITFYKANPKALPKGKTAAQVLPALESQLATLKKKAEPAR